MDSIKTQLMDMGFDESKVKRALESNPEAQTLEQVMEWLIAHEDDLNTQSTTNQQEAMAATGAAASEKNGDRSNLQEGELNETAANMAERKKITVEEAQKRITERQARRVEEERKKEIEDEKRRRYDGQKMAETREELQNQERIRLAQQIRQEKLMKERDRREIVEKIRRDREAMKARSEPNRDEPKPVVKPTSSSSSPTFSGSECKIALRFADGENLIHKFSPKEQLSAVRLFVQVEKNIQPNKRIEFVAPPNRKLSDEQMNESLESLGLCPASRLEVKLTHEMWDMVD